MRRLTVVVLVGCSSSSSGTKPQNPDCAMDVSVSGGYTWTSASIAAYSLGCGSIGSAGSYLDVDAYGGSAVYHELQIDFDAMLGSGQVGTVTAAVEFTGEDPAITRSTWKTAAGACSIDVTRNEYMQDSFFKNKFIIEGDGTCSTALAPDTSNTYPAVTVDPFSFRSFFSYGP